MNQTDPVALGRFDRLFFPGMALLILAVVFTGFASTYFLAGMFRAPLPNLLIHVHGAAFSLWILLFLVQTSLVAAGQVDVHRRIGLLAFGLACLMVILGTLAATDALVREETTGADSAKTFYAVPLADMAVFGGLVYVAFRNRFRPDAHKRAILIATIALLDAAFVRWFAPAPWWTLRTAQVCCYPLLLFLAVYDLRSMGRIHRVTLWAGALLIATHFAVQPIGNTALWQSFATWAQNSARMIR